MRGWLRQGSRGGRRAVGSDEVPTKTRRRLLKLAATFVVLFAVCLAIVLRDGGATRVDVSGVTAGAQVSEAVPQLRDEDPHHYLGLGHDIAQNGGLPSGSARILNWWPPGMHLYYAGLFTVFGLEMPVGVVAGAAMALLWAALLTAYVDLLGRHLHGAVLAAMIGIVLLSDLVQDWILGLGLFWSEGLYTWCLLAALYASMRSATGRSDATRFGWAGAVGVVLGVSAYVRTVSDLLGWLMIGLLVAWGALTLLRLALRRWQAHRGGRAPGPSRTWHQQLLALLVCVVAFQIVTVPWRIFAAQNLRPGNYTWSVAPNGVWHDSWTPDRVLVARDQQWLLAGRPNTACKVDQVTCKEIAEYELKQLAPYSGWGRYTEREYRRLAVRAFVRHPVAYTADRLTHLRKAWFWDPQGQQELLQNGVLLAAVIGAFWLSVRRVRKSGPDLVALLFPGLTLATMAPFAFLHYEARYFVTMKLVALAAVLVLLALDPAAAKVLRVSRPVVPVPAPSDPVTSNPSA